MTEREIIDKYMLDNEQEATEAIELLFLQAVLNPNTNVNLCAYVNDGEVCFTITHGDVVSVQQTEDGKTLYHLWSKKVTEAELQTIRKHSYEVTSVSTTGEAKDAVDKIQATAADV